MSLEPCMGAFIGIIFLHEHLTLIQWVALAFIVLALYWFNGNHKSKTKIEEVK